MSPIETVKSKKDGIYLVYYFGELVGWIQPSKLLGDGHRKGYRALSIHGDLSHVFSLKSGRDWLLATYH